MRETPSMNFLRLASSHCRLYWLLGILSLVVGCAPAPTSEVDREQAIEQMEVQLTLAHPDLERADQLTSRIQETLARELDGRRMDSQVNAAWQIMHGVVAYGFDLEIDTPDRGLVGALEYALSNGEINGFELSTSQIPLPLTGRPGVKAKLEPGSYVGQGHPDQWLAICAMANIPLETEVQVGETRLTLLDWARQAQFDVPNNLLNEFSWTLIALTHYFPDEPSWRSDGGDSFSWELLVEAELTYDLNDSACGGTHRLAGIVRALHAKERLGLADSQVWQEAQAAVDERIANAKRNRSANGALSSHYFVRPSRTVDLAAELSSSGHVFEFLALALPQDQLREPWVELAAVRLCEVLELTQDVDLDCGALYHALNGLKLYSQRTSAL